MLSAGRGEAMSLRKKVLSSTVNCILLGSALGIPWSSVAFAVDNLSTDSGKSTAIDQTASTPQESDKNAKPVKQLNSVTVTAQSRSQEVQAVPISLQIVTAKQIDTLAATDLSRMSQFIPGLVVDGSQPTQPTYTMRGITTDDFGVGTDSAVGVYIDGVYAARSGGALLAFNDIKRIEVLKGPQGTLFGRNAAGGAISIVTNEPSDKFEGKVVARIGNYGEHYENALLNIPINKDMALRVSVLDNQSDGWIKDQATGQHYGKNDDWGSRMVYRWNITPDTRMLLSWDHEKLNQPPAAYFGLAPLVPNGTRPPFPPEPGTYLDPTKSPLYNDDVGAEESRLFDGVTLSIDHSFPWGSLVSTTAFRHFTSFNREDNDGTDNIDTYLSTANAESNTSLYQEFRFSGENDLMDWVAGASYYRERARQDNIVDLNTNSVDTLLRNAGAIPTPDGTLFGYLSQALAQNGLPYSLLGDPWEESLDDRGKYQSYAAFGDVIWHLNDNLNLTTGLRFTRDDKQFTWYNPPRTATALDSTISALNALGFFNAAGIPAAFLQQNIVFPNNVGQAITMSNSWNDFSPRAVLDYKFSPDVMGYVSVTKGYKSGGFDAEQIGGEFKPEKIWNYEAGLKTTIPDDHLVLNASVYRYLYSNLQAINLVAASSTSSVPIYTVSSSNQQAVGVDLEAKWQPIDALTVNLTAAYIDSTYSKFITPEGLNLAGEPSGEPLWSLAGGFDYVWPALIENGDVDFSLSQSYRTRTRCNGNSDLQGYCLEGATFNVGGPQSRTDLHLGWNSHDGRYGISLFANNVLDKRYVMRISNVSTSIFGTPIANINPPRMWGVEFRASF